MESRDDTLFLYLFRIQVNEKGLPCSSIMAMLCHIILVVTESVHIMMGVNWKNTKNNVMGVSVLDPMHQLRFVCGPFGRVSFHLADFH